MGDKSVQIVLTGIVFPGIAQNPLFPGISCGALVFWAEGGMELCAFLVSQLRQRLVEDAAIAVRAGSAARDAAQNSVSAMEKRQDGRTMIEQGNMAYAQARRADQALGWLQAIDTFSSGGYKRYDARTPIGLGAIIDVLSEDEQGEFSRTFVMLPVGAGEELTGPDGDGIITVLTPHSPVGKSMLGKRVGDIAEVTLQREPWEWEILEVSS